MGVPLLSNIGGDGFESRYKRVSMGQKRKSAAIPNKKSRNAPPILKRRRLKKSIAILKTLRMARIYSFTTISDAGIEALIEGLYMQSACRGG